MKRAKTTLRNLLVLLLLLIGGALLLDSRSVEKIDPQAGGYAPVASGGQPPAPMRSAVPVADSRLALGARYTSLDQLVTDQQAAGFVRTGYFGKHWPAEVSEIQTADDGIGFVRQDGTPHQYQGFEGYRMKMVRLIDPGKRETVVVFRSVDKR
jgi:hypothetical protein